MNKFFYPGTEKIDKPGLERHHQLIESSTLRTAIQSQKKVRESLPNNWIYNDNKAKEVWSELEQFEPCSRGVFKPEGPSPLAKIDESATKIRNTITNFEVQDQEFLMEFMNLLDDDSLVDSLDQSSILFEARYRLQQMIEEHIDFGERQATLLSNLTTWFTDVKSKEQDESVSTSFLKEPNNSITKVDDLRRLIDDYKSTSNGQIERAENLHEDMVQNLNERVNDCQKIISQKDLELTQLNQNLQQANSKRKGRVFNVRDSIHYDAELAFSQRRVMELQEQLNTIKTSLSEYTKIKKSDSLREIMIMANLDNNDKDNSRNSSLQSERNSVALTTVNINEMNFSKLKDNADGLISVEREIEFESKLCVLANQIKNLKDDNKMLQEQIMQNRQSEIVNEKRIQSIERQKKTTESALQTVNKKMENMKESYERRIKELQSDFSTDGSFARENESFLELKKTYEAKMEKMSEDYRKQIQFIQDSMDKRYQKQVADVFKSCKFGDASAALEQVTTNFQQQVLELERHFQKELKDEKRNNAEKLVNLTKYYETLIKKKDKEIEKTKNSIESEIQSRLFEIKIELDDRFNSKSFEDHENAVNEYNEIRRKMQGSIDLLKEKLLKVTRERDTLKSLVNSNDLAVELLDDLNNEFNEEEEEGNLNKQTKNDDEILNDSLFSLREKEIEQKVSEKFSLLLKAQKETLSDFYLYELENTKKYFKLQFQSIVNEFRQKAVEKTSEISDRLIDETKVDGYQKEVENLLVETVKLATFDSDYEIDELFRNPTIPISELDNKVDNYRNQVIELTSENEFWKATFKHYENSQNRDNNRDSDNKENGGSSVIDSMKSVIEKQSKRMAEIDKENRNLIDKLRKIPSSKLQLLDDLTIPIEIGELVEFHLYNEGSFDEGDDSISFNQTKAAVSQSDKKQTEIKTTNSFNSNAASDNNNSDKTFVVNKKGKVCCFHCHSSYSPKKVSKQCVICQLSQCPKCSHLSLMPQTEEVEIVDERNKPTSSPSPSKSTEDTASCNSAGDLSLLTVPNLDEQPTFSPPVQPAAKKSEPQQKQQKESPRQLPHEYELQLQKQQNEQTQEELEKALQRNEQLKDKLSLFEKNFGDLERQYIKKINKLNDDISNLQKGFIEDSLSLVHSALQLPDDQPENLEKKISTSEKIAQMLKTVEFPSSTVTKTFCQEFIDFTEDKLTKEASFDDANESLNQAESVLVTLSSDPQASRKRPNTQPKNSSSSTAAAANANNETSAANNDADDLLSERDSILACKINVCKMNIDILREHNDFVAQIVNEILEQMKRMNTKIKQIGKCSIRMAQDMKDELKTVSADLNLIIEQRTKAMNDARNDLLKQKSAYDALQEKFRTSIAAFEQLQLSSSTNQDEVLILKRKEDDQIQTIESLTNKLLQSQENNRNNEKEIEQLKLRIMELESEQLLISVRLDTQKNNENEENCQRFNSEETQVDEEEENEDALSTEKEKENNESEKVSGNQSAVNLPAPLPSIQSIESNQLEFVPSFVVFSTDEKTESNRKKGFSLLPRRLVLQQSKPVFADAALTSPLPSPLPQPPQLAPAQQALPEAPTSSSTAATNNGNSSAVADSYRPPAGQKHEKIRVKYMQNNCQPAALSGAPNARVIVPKSRPKTSSFSRTQPNPTQGVSSTPPALPSAPASEDGRGENAPQISRVLSFENLVPLMENDVVTGSLIGYVTRYVPEKASLEYQAKIREEKKKILRTSSVLISEVPPEKLRFDNANSSQLGTKSMMSFGAKSAVNSNSNSVQNPNTINGVPSTSSVNRLQSMKSQKNAPRIPHTKEDWIEKCERKIKSLEAQLRESSNLLQEERDKSHRAIQTAFKAGIELRQSQRQQKKATLLLDATKKRLEQALEIVSKSDNEIARLKKLLNEVSNIARSIEQKETNEKENVVDFDDVEHHAFPTKKRVLQRANKLSILSNFEDESKRLLSVFRGVCSGITSMAQKEIESIRKWAPKKDRYVNTEKMKLMSALEAMRFITSPDAYNTDNKKSLKSAVKVKSFDLKLKKKQQQQKRPTSRPAAAVKDENETSFEKATVTANMHNQKVPKSLRKGVIGRPATSYSNVV